jgi:hypothetical protein
MVSWFPTILSAQILIKSFMVAKVPASEVVFQRWMQTHTTHSLSDAPTAMTYSSEALDFSTPEMAEINLEWWITRVVLMPFPEADGHLSESTWYQHTRFHLTLGLVMYRRRTSSLQLENNISAAPHSGW